MPPLKKVNFDDDFGAIDDDADLGAIDAPEETGINPVLDDLGAVDDPTDVNPLEINKRLEEQGVEQAAASALETVKQQAVTAADPANWSLAKTKDHFKENPPQNVGEEAVSQIMLDKKKSDLKAQKTSIIAQIVRGFMRGSPLEQLKTTQHIYDNRALIPEVQQGESMRDYAKRFNQVLNLPEREKEIETQGTIHQFEDLMTVGIGAGFAAAPLHTAKILAAFTGIEKLADMAGINKPIQNVKGATARDVLDIAKFGIEGIFAGGMARLKPAQWFTKDNKPTPALLKEADKIIDVKAADKPLEVVAAAKDVVRDLISDDPVVVKKFQAKVFLELDKVNKERTEKGIELSAQEQAAQDWVLKNPKQARENYINRSEKEFKSDNVVSADIGKFAIDDPASGLKMTAARSADFHESGSALSKAREVELLADKSTRDKPTAFTAGGSGSGKSNLLRSRSEAQGHDLKDDYGLVYDTNLNNYKSSIEKINANLKDGRKIEINFVYRDPMTSWEDGVIPRVKKQDRIVPISEHIKTHRDSLKTFDRIAEEFKDDPRLNFNIYDNSFAKGEFKTLNSLDEVPVFDYTNIESKLYESTKQAYESGKLTEEQFQTALEGSPALKKRAVEESYPIGRGREVGDRPLESPGAPAPRLEEPTKIVTPEPSTKEFVNVPRNTESLSIAKDLFEYVNGLEGPQTLKSVEGEFTHTNDWPPFLSDKGYTKLELMNILDKFRSGAKLTDKQQEIVNDIIPKFARQVEENIPAEEGKRRKFIQTVKSAEKTVPEVAQKIESLYTPISNKETLAQAQEFVKTDYNAAIEEVMGNSKPTAFSNAAAIVLIDKAQAEGRIADAVSLVERTAEKQTPLGQAIQALSIYNRLGPEGILMLAQRTFRKAFPEKVSEFLKKAKGLNETERGKLADKMKVPHISEILAKELTEMANRIKEMPEGREKQIETALMLKKITDLIPRGFGKKLSIIQTMSQLLNPKTFVRNLLGNVGFWMMESIADYTALSLDIMASLMTGKRTVYAPDFVGQAKGFVQGFKEGTEEAIKGVNLKQAEESKFTLPKNGVFDKGVMGGFEKTLRIALGATDRAFYQAAFNQSIRDQMLSLKERGKGINEPTEEMIERAHLFGLYRTFQDDSVLSKQFVKLKHFLNFEKDFGIGDVILKYPKTPANILSRGIEYSPFGFIKAMYEFAKPHMGDKEFDQESFVRSTSRALTGSSLLIGTGALMAGLGIISGKRVKDRDVEEARQEVGIRQYQINVSALKRFVMSGFDPDLAKLREDDTLVSYDWMLPSSIGLALGANMVIDPKGNKVDKVINFAESLAQASETLQEQPLVQGVKRFAQQRNVAEAITDTLKEIPASFVPTVLNQIRQLTDNTARNSRDPNYIKEMYNKAVMRIPGAASKLPPKITARGEEKQMYQLGTNNPFNVFLNPAFVTKYKPDPVSKMVLDIWDMTGETVQFPRVVEAKIKLGAQTPEPIELNAEQYTEFQRYIGNKTDVLFSILADDEGFLGQTDEFKAKKLQGLLTDIYTAGKIEVLGYRPKNLPQDVLSIIKFIADDKNELDAVDDDELGAVDDED